jgi:formylglycine-generating enzyme required for sulfatase activity
MASMRESAMFCPGAMKRASLIAILLLVLRPFSFATISKDEIIVQLRRSVPSWVIESRARRQGVTFAMDEQIASELRSKGASESLIRTLFEMSNKNHSTPAGAQGQGEKNMPLPGTRMESLNLPFNVKMDFVWIPPGEFEMGCSHNDGDCPPNELPQHRVRITKGFEMGVYKVTHQQWAAVMRNKRIDSTVPVGWALPSDYGSTEDKRLDLRQFLTKLNARDDKYDYRLPTEAEWEYAARSGTTEKLYGPLDEIAWYENNSGGIPHPVGQKRANAWGLFDMIGNVDEWCSDRYSPDYYKESPFDDPKGPDHGVKGEQGGVAFTLRGQVYLSSASSIRVSNRWRGPDYYQTNYYDGFRVVRQRRNQ